jgi:hypothetical protein
MVQSNAVTMYKHFKCDDCRYLVTTLCGDAWVDSYWCRNTFVLRWGSQHDDYIAVAPDEISLWRTIKDELLWWPAIVEACDIRGVVL